MKHTTRIRRIVLRTLATAAVAGGAAASAAAQDASTNYRPATADPFVKSAPVVRAKKVVEKKKPVPAATVVAPPSIKARIEAFKEQRVRAMTAQQTAPKPTVALLLGEVQITGIFRTPRGYAAMVEATPIKLSYVVYPGEKFYDGQLVAIEEGRLVFRREQVWTNGRRDVNVEMKPLRKFAPADQLAAAADKLKDTDKGAKKTAAVAAADAEAKPKAEQPDAEKPEKPDSEKDN